jgi:hypothetical protein
MLPPEYEDWAQRAASYFSQYFGLSGPMALDAGRLYIALWSHGLNPRPTSGWRSPAYQASLRAAWDRGDRSGLRARPADPRTSAHCRTSLLGVPASGALDMVTDDDSAAAQIAVELGIGAGQYFRRPDQGHYYTRGV